MYTYIYVFSLSELIIKCLRETQEGSEPTILCGLFVRLLADTDSAEELEIVIVQVKGNVRFIFHMSVMTITIICSLSYNWGHC